MKTMPNSSQEEKLRWINPILEKKISIKTMSEVCPFGERTLKDWLAKYRKDGLVGLENKSTRPKTQPNETAIRVKERIIELRRETDLAALKIRWYLSDEGIDVHERTAGRILKAEGLTRRYRTRKQYPKKSKVQLRPGELTEIDVKYVPSMVEGKKCYQFTAIDCASRWRFLRVYDQQTNFDAIEFLKELIAIFPYEIKAIKTDNGAIFTNRYNGYLKSVDPMNPRLHPLDLLCQELGIIHYLIDPGKPAQNGRVERSHRSDQESFYDKIKYDNLEELRYQIKLWNMYYNDLKHCGLNGRTPNEVLRPKVQYVLS
jgi:transposase InsO family protein